MMLPVPPSFWFIWYKRLFNKWIIDNIFVTAFMSWVLADDMTADKGIPCLSVKICHFVHILLLSTGLLPTVMSLPPKGDFIDILSSDCCQIHPIPFLLSYSFNNLIQILLNISNWTHCWNRRWHVEPEPYSLGSFFPWQPVLRTYRIPSSLSKWDYRTANSISWFFVW